MRIDRRFLEWGLFFVLLGGIPLLVHAGVLDPQALTGAWRLWPLIVVGLGLGLILRRTSLALFGGLVVAATFGVIFGSLLAAGPAFGSIGRDCGSTAGGTRFADQTGTFSGSQASVVLHLSCRNVTLATADGTGWTIAGSSKSGQPPQITASAEDLTVRSDEDGIPFFEFGAGRGDWQITLPRGLPIDLSTTAGFGDLDANLAGAKVDSLSLTVNFASARVDLSQASLQNLSVTANFGSTVLRLPSASIFQGSITANFGSLNLCVPEGVGLRITVGGGAFSSTDFGGGLTQIGNTWTSRGYDTAAARIDLSTTANFGNVQLDGEACQ